MAEKLDRKIVVGIGGAAIALAVIIGAYIMLVRPQMKGYRETRAAVKERQTRLDELREAFGNQDDPKIELGILSKEVENLSKASSAFDKIKKAGVESTDLPEELRDPDSQIRLELFRDYIKEVMSVSEKNILNDLTSVNITPPDIELYTQLDKYGEASYYMNRAGGLQGVINSLVRTQSGSKDKIIFDKLKIEDYDKGKDRKSAAGNVLSYFVGMTMDMDNLVSMIYNLQEEDGYYFVEEMSIKPSTRGRFDGGEVKLLVDARINTVMIYRSEVESEVKRVMKKAGQADVQDVAGSALSGFFALAVGGERQIEEELERKKNKKWYEFWK